MTYTEFPHETTLTAAWAQDVLGQALQEVHAADMGTLTTVVPGGCVPVRQPEVA